MKYILLVISILLATVSFSGCVQQVVEEIDYPNYSKGHDLEYIYFQLPDKESKEQIDVTLTYPSGDVRGTFTRVMDKRSVNIYVSETLSETGTYTIRYETDSFIMNEYFFVGSTPDIVRLDIIEAELVGSELSIKIRNNGRDTGKFYLVIYDQETTTSMGRTVYNRQYVHEIVNIRPGFDYQHYCYVSSSKLVVLINEDLYELEF